MVTERPGALGWPSCAWLPSYRPGRRFRPFPCCHLIGRSHQFLGLGYGQRGVQIGEDGPQAAAQPDIEEIGQIGVADVVVVRRVGGDDFVGADGLRLGICMLCKTYWSMICTSNSWSHSLSNPLSHYEPRARELDDSDLGPVEGHYTDWTPLEGRPASSPRTSTPPIRGSSGTFLSVKPQP